MADPRQIPFPNQLQAALMLHIGAFCRTSTLNSLCLHDLSYSSSLSSFSCRATQLARTDQPALDMYTRNEMTAAVSSAVAITVKEERQQCLLKDKVYRKQLAREWKWWKRVCIDNRKSTLAQIVCPKLIVGFFSTGVAETTRSANRLHLCAEAM